MDGSTETTIKSNTPTLKQFFRFCSSRPGGLAKYVASSALPSGAVQGDAGTREYAALLDHLRLLVRQVAIGEGDHVGEEGDLIFRSVYDTCFAYPTRMFTSPTEQ